VKFNYFIYHASAIASSCVLLFAYNMFIRTFLSHKAHVVQYAYYEMALPIRVIRVWNILPDCVNFTTYNDFKRPLTTSVLIKFCKLFFYVMRIAVVLLVYYSVLYSFIAM